MSRYAPDPVVCPYDARYVTIAEGSPTQWWRSAVQDVSQYLDVDRKHPVCLLVPSKRSYVTSSLIRATVCSVRLPDDSFYSAELLKNDSFLAIESPAHSFASMAAALSAAISRGVLNHLEARGLLLAYGYELCGSYARDALDPINGECRYRLKPVTSPEQLVTWCQTRQGHGAPGIRLARECAPAVLAGSASPAESIHGIVFTSNPWLGGLGMRDVLINETIPLNPEERMLVHRTPLTPDLTFPSLGNRVLEHQGGDHDSPRQYQEDACRVQDYGALGRGVIMTSAADFESPDAYDRFLRRFFAWVRHDLGPRPAERYQAILNNTAYSAARHDLVATLIDRIHDPWHW